MKDFIGNIATNGVLIIALGFFVKRWINGTQASIFQHFKDNREDYQKINDKIDDIDRRITRLEERK